MDAQPYPARLDGQLDPAVSQWLSLGKWPRTGHGHWRSALYCAAVPASVDKPTGVPFRPIRRGAFLFWL